MSGHKITVVGTGYVGMSMAVLLAQHNDVTASDIDGVRVAIINQGKSTVKDMDIQKFLDDRELSLTATMDKKEAYEEAEFIIIATPTDYDPESNYSSYTYALKVMDSENDPRVDISAIKIYVPEAMHRVVDRAIQVYGWKGVSADLPLFGMYQGARTLRLADGPDEVHRILIAKQVLKKYHQGLSWDFGI